MNSTLERAILQITRLSEVDQKRIGNKLLAHVERLGALRAEIDKGIHSLEAGKGRALLMKAFISNKNASRRWGRAN